MVGNPSWQNPPLQEAIFEIRFPPVKDYTLFVAELFSKNREYFPKTQPLPTADLPTSIIIGGQVRHRFIGKDNDIVFQVGPDTLSINIIRYSGFNKFKINIIEIIDTTREYIKLTSLNQISLRYINRFGKIQNPFVTLNIDSPFPAYDASKAKGLQVSYTREENNMIFISTNVVFPVENSDLILDINAFFINKEVKKNWDLDSIIEWTNNAHDLIYDNFERLVAEKEKKVRK